MTHLIDLAVSWAMPVGSAILLKGTIVVAVAGLVAFLARRSSAATRHAIWGSALVALVLLPAMSLSLPKMFVSLPSWEAGGVSPVRTATPGQVGPQQRVGALLHSQGGRAGSEVPVVRVAVTAEQEHENSAEFVALSVQRVPLLSIFALAALTIWAAGALVLLAGFALSTARVRAVSRRALAAARDGNVLGRRRIELRLGIPGSVTVVTSGEVSMPVCWGLFNPVVILPTNAEGWPSDRKSAVMLHEIAHATRCDYLAHVLGEIARAIYWPNPFVWYAVRMAAMEREHACDDEALNVGIRSDVYAKHLLDVVLSQTNGYEMNGAIAMAGRSNLARRVRNILAHGTSRAPVSRRILAATTVVAGLVTMPVAALELFEKCEASEGHAEHMQLQGPRSVEERITELRSGNARERRYAAWALGELEDVRGVEPLHESLGDDDADVRLVAAWALGEIKDEQSIDPLIEIVDDEDPLVREMAVLALGEIEHPRAVDVLVEALERDETLIGPAIWALGEIDSYTAYEARMAVFEALGRRPWDNVEVWAGEWLGWEGPRRERDLPILIQALDDRDPEIRQHGAWEIGHLDDERAVEALLDLLRDENPSVRAMAVWALDETNPSRRLRRVAQ
jgi:HEAT repeat protein/beta-lactamase regulating signal transducer with metallopeptidase domain